MGGRTHAGLAGILATVLAGCLQASFNHGDPSMVDTDTGASAGVVSGVGGTGDLDLGNYPHPAVTRCGDVLGGVEPIDGLVSAWAIVAVPGATRGGEPVDTGSVLLRVSEEGLSDCGAAPFEGFSSSTGSTGTTSGDTVAGDRTIEILLGPDESVVGRRDVADLEDSQVALFGGGATEIHGSEASVELLRVDDDCVIGIVHGFEATDGGPFLEGGFVAQTCQQQCIPTAGSGC